MLNTLQFIYEFIVTIMDINYNILNCKYILDRFFSFKKEFQ